MRKILFLITILLLTGCYNYRELNNFAIIKGVAIDVDNNKYVVNYLVSKTNKNSKANETIMLEGKGRTISDAIAEINLSSNKELYIGHMFVLVASEDVAKIGINKVTDFFFRSPNSKKTFQILISKDQNAKNILETLSSLDNFQTNSIIENLANENSFASFAINTTLLSFLKNTKDPGIEPITSGITTIDDNGKKNIKITPLALFRNDKFIKWETEEISKGITILINQSSYSKINTSCQNGNVIFLINNLKVNKSLKINKKINFKIKITGNSEISEMNCNYDLKKVNDLNKLEKIMISEMKEVLNKTINEIKESKIDSIGLGYYIYQTDYKNWLKVKNNYLDNLNVEFEIVPNLLVNENANEGTINKYE